MNLDGFAVIVMVDGEDEDLSLTKFVVSVGNCL